MDAQFRQSTISTTKHRNSDFETDSKQPHLKKTGDSKNIPILIAPQYDTFQHLIVVAKCIFMMRPRGVSIDEDRGHIYVADCYSDRIVIFSETGDIVSEFPTSSSPYGVLVVEDRVYVTDSKLHKLSMYSIPDYQMISSRKVGI